MRKAIIARQETWITSRAPADQPKPSAHRSVIGARRQAAALVHALLTLALGASQCWAQEGAPSASPATSSPPLPPLRLKKSQEIAPFRITSIESFVEARVLSDANNDSGLPPAGLEGGASAPGGKSGVRTKQSNLIYEVNLLTHGYIYHPSLISFDLGGGPLIDKASYDQNGVATDGKRQLYNLHARATVLREKPYSGAVFFDRKNENQSIGPAMEMLTENTLYGLNFNLRNPVIRTPLEVNLVHSERLGRGSEQIIEDRSDQLRLKLEADLGRQGWIPFEDVKGESTFQFETKRQDSISGSTGLSIQANSNTDDRLSLDTHLDIGDKREYELVNAISLTSNKYTAGQGHLTEMKNFSFGLDMYGRHSEDLQTNGRYHLNTFQQGDQKTTVNAASGGVNYNFSPDLTGNLAAQAESAKSPQVSSSSYGLNGSVQYQQPLPLGRATLNYNFGYRQNEQEAMAPEAKMIGEHVTLSGTTLASLSREQVAVTSVVVSNLTRTQTFVQGSDYQFSPIGLNLRIQRVIGGNILDGQEVLIDYIYATGGTYALSQLDNTINLSWALKNYLKVFQRYMVSTPQLISGVSTTPLNPARSTVRGAQTDLPFNLLNQEFQVGGNLEREDRREAILPSKRASFETYAQTDLPWIRRGFVRLSKRGLRIDYDFNPTQGINQISYDLRLGMSPGFGLTLFADASRMRDTGTPLAREYSVASIKAKWRIRKLSASFDVNRVRESQGKADRLRTFGQFTLRRDF
ncbi:MAG: hypothetical protein PHQ05_08995 [Sterolibacterium sp.]|nr:hypothetical protein [Sterolibacterium sp.]